MVLGPVVPGPVGFPLVNHITCLAGDGVSQVSDLAATFLYLAGDTPLPPTMLLPPRGCVGELCI